jgi:hypothetical protein
MQQPRNMTRSRETNANGPRGKRSASCLRKAGGSNGSRARTETTTGCGARRRQGRPRGEQQVTPGRGSREPPGPLGRPRALPFHAHHRAVRAGVTALHTVGEPPAPLPVVILQLCGNYPRTREPWSYHQSVRRLYLHGGMIAALLEREETTGRRWLSFPSSPLPPLAVRGALARAGWHYHRGLRAWHDAGEAGLRMPRGFIVARGGTCEYGWLRPLPVAAGLALFAGLRERLSTRASVGAGGRS